MRARNPMIWLMTDERMGDAVIAAARGLPPGSGIVFRHHATPEAERRRLFRVLKRIARARRLTIVSRGDLPGGDGRHGRGPTAGLRTWAAHDRREAVTGAKAGADWLFVSPVFPTRSHPGARALGAMRASRIGRGLGAQVIVLGGMDARRWRRISRLGFDGWAAIDSLTPPPR